MKLRWMLLPMLQLAFAHTDFLAAAPAPAVWTVDPAVPGPDSPAAGASLFDRITTDQTRVRENMRALKGTSEQLRAQILGCMSQRGASMLKEDMEALEKAGTGRLVGPGASTEEAIDYVRTEVRARRARRGA